MNRHDIITTIGSKHLQSNIENNEWSYPKAFKDKGLPEPQYISGRKYIDLRFVNDGITVLVETKSNFNKDPNAISQLQAYVSYEKQLTGNKIVAILANTIDDQIMVWRGAVGNDTFMPEQITLQPFEEYSDMYTHNVNDKEQVMLNTFKLNELLHKHGISEKLRSQFVGTCLLALKNGLTFNEKTTASQINKELHDTLDLLLPEDDSHPDKIDKQREAKLRILKTNVLKSQDLKRLTDAGYRAILTDIRDNILPFINDKSTAGQDLLNLFFVQFNKYVGKADKNQAFTPDHIADFMAKAIKVNKNSRILDPCCGSGSFLVRAMMLAMDDCATTNERKNVKTDHIYGIEFEDTAFGLSTTNMLIHADGNSHIVQDSCFNRTKWIENAHINRVLMNPPYNASRAQVPDSYSSTWPTTTKEDPSKGLYFVDWVAKAIQSKKFTDGKLAAIVPMACAIGGSKAKEITRLKKSLLIQNTLDAVFTFPSDVFHPGSNASVCCMIFTIGESHVDRKTQKAKPTFFGYFKDDGYTKKKNLGRVEQIDRATGSGRWEAIEQRWLELYENRKVVPGLSALEIVTGDDEWLAEAYIDTDYSSLTKADFATTLRDYRTHSIRHGKKRSGELGPIEDISAWEPFAIEKVFTTLDRCKVSSAAELEDGDEIDYLGAKKEDGGFMRRVRKEDALVTKGNCIVFIGDGQGSVGFTNYVRNDFMGTINLTAGYHEKLNSHNAQFLVTILDKERPKYSYGRKWSSKIAETMIRLPAKNGEPDWEFMTNYIKNLPNANQI